MGDIKEIFWDMDDEQDGNVQHIADHDLTKEEVAEVLLNPDSTDVSQSSGLPIAFGWTSTGRYIAVIYEEVKPDGAWPVTAYDVPPPAKKRRKS
jgi:hypothetical protein